MTMTLNNHDDGDDDDDSQQQVVLLQHDNDIHPGSIEIEYNIDWQVQNTARDDDDDNDELSMKQQFCASFSIRK